MTVRKVVEVLSGRETRDGAVVKIISGEVGNESGPVADVVIDPLYLDVTLGSGKAFSQPVERGYTVFAHVFEGTLVKR